MENSWVGEPPIADLCELLPSEAIAGDRLVRTGTGPISAPTDNLFTQGVSTESGNYFNAEIKYKIVGLADDYHRSSYCALHNRCSSMGEVGTAGISEFRLENFQTCSRSQTPRGSRRTRFFK